MYKQVLDPVGNSLFLSTLFAVLPLVTLFVLLGGLKLKAHVAALWSLLVAILVAIIVYSMPRRPDARLRPRGRGLRPLPDHVDRRQLHLDLHHARAQRVLRGHQALVRAPQRGRARAGGAHRLLLRRPARGAGRLRHPGRDLLGHAHGAGLQARQGRRRRRSWPTPRRSPSAPSRCRSRRWRRWPSFRRTTSAPWSAARRPSSPSIVPLILVGMVDGRRGIKAGVARRGLWAASPSPSASSRARTTSRSSWPTSSPPCSRRGAIIALLQVWQPGETLRAEVDTGARPAMAGGESGVDQRRFEKEATLRAGARATAGSSATRPARCSSPSRPT